LIYRRTELGGPDISGSARLQGTKSNVRDGGGYYYPGVQVSDGKLPPATAAKVDVNPHWRNEAGRLEVYALDTAGSVSVHFQAALSVEDTASGDFSLRIDVYDATTLVATYTYSLQYLTDCFASS
jgi:hypothetical protein